MTDFPPELTASHALFLDFDGTLVDIAPTPDAVVVPDGLVPALERVRDKLGGAIAIVSGREIGYVTQMLSPLVLPAAGSHGAERRRADGVTAVPGARVQAEAYAISARIEQALTDRTGILIERKAYSVAVHYRAAPERESEVADVAKTVATGYLGWQVLTGKRVVEIRPRQFSKASAVSAFMKEAPFAGRVPVFVGDDVTDEDGMRAAIVHGGFGVRVGPGESVGQYRLGSPADVLNYLKALAD